MTLTGSGDLAPAARFFTAGDTAKIVYTRDAAESAVRTALGHAAVVVAAGDPVDLGAVLDDLGERKVERLMVEGGGTIHTQFLAAGLVDEIHLVIAPFLVGEPDAPRFVHPNRFPQNRAQPMTLAETRQIGDAVLLRYLAGTRKGSDQDRVHLRSAIDLAASCPPSRTAFSVGTLIVDAEGTVLATGYSRETHPHDHAEEAALAKLPAGDPLLRGATIYSSLEPCSTRASRPRSCTELILATSIPRVVFAWREPELFVDCEGAERLRTAGREVVELPDLAPLVRRTNAHLLGS